jgi:A/G-specific adenine glycosylase
VKILNRAFAKGLVKWFGENKQGWPWRLNATPYSVWISEVMLQQTVLKTVCRYFDKWMTIFPDVSHLAAASENDVLVVWEGLGYYSRAKNCLRAARIILEKYNGHLPSDYKALTFLPGIGDYTASAILSIAFHRPYPAIDANVRRVFQRLLKIKENLAGLKEKLKAILPSDNPGDFNQALMELGQTICLPHHPLCSSCPLKKQCLSFRYQVQDLIPVKKTSKLVTKYTLVLILVCNKSVWAMQKEKGLFKTLWIFPGINYEESHKVLPGMIPSEHLVSSLDRVIHYYTRYKDYLYPRIYRVKKKFPEYHFNGQWVDLKLLDSLPFPSAYRKIIKNLHLSDHMNVVG